MSWEIEDNERAELTTAVKELETKMEDVSLQVVCVLKLTSFRYNISLSITAVRKRKLSDTLAFDI